jgi:sugar phosphate isomerase/epimerase
MQIGICTSTENSASVRAAGFDYVEDSVQGLLQGLTPDVEWSGARRIASTDVPVRACNMLVPGSLKITGPDVDRDALKRYMQAVLRRADQLDIRTLVFGSGGARNVPEGFDREQARQQITTFVRDFVADAQRHNVTVVLEPLNRKECNIINSVAEAMTYVQAVNHPNFQCLLDTYHFWLEDEPLENLRKYVQSIRHVHLADKEGRVAPGLSGKDDYKPVFRILKQAGYTGRISFEGSPIPEFSKTAPAVVEYIRRQWIDA